MRLFKTVDPYRPPDSIVGSECLLRYKGLAINVLVTAIAQNTDGGEPAYCLYYFEILQVTHCHWEGLGDLLTLLGKDFQLVADSGSRSRDWELAVLQDD